MVLVPHDIITMRVWFPLKVMYNTSTNTTSNKYLGKYLEATLTVVCTLTLF